jgi:hypothetical protein
MADLLRNKLQRVKAAIEEAEKAPSNAAQLTKLDVLWDLPVLLESTPNVSFDLKNRNLILFLVSTVCPAPFYAYAGSEIMITVS